MGSPSVTAQQRGQIPLPSALDKASLGKFFKTSIQEGQPPSISFSIFSPFILLALIV